MKSENLTSLDNAVLLQRGFDLPAYAREPGNIPVVASTGIAGHHSVAKAQPPGVIIGRSGSIGGGQYLRTPYWPLNTTLWVKDFQGNDPRFVYYLLRGIDFTQINAGSGVPTLNRNHLKGIFVWLPRLAEQQRVATILTGLDDKIESNRRLAALLDETVSMIFKARFADSVRVTKLRQSKTRKSNAGTIADLCQTRYGYTASATDDPIGPRFLRVKDINKRPWIDWATVPYCEIDSSRMARVQLLPGDIVVARMADPGKVAIILDQLDAVCASYLVRLRPTSLAWAYFLHRYMRSAQYENYIDSVMSGSVQKNINARVLTAAPLVIPDEEDLVMFARSVGPIYHYQASLIREVSSLVSIRDTLLPKLVSGEIRVPDTNDPDEVIGPAAAQQTEAAK